VARPATSAIDRVLLTVLQNDAPLAALLPDGVYGYLAPAGLKAFGLVTVVDADDEGVFGHRGAEGRRYAVQALGLSRDVALEQIKAAGDRIDALLEGAALSTPADYGSIDCVRDGSIDTSARDEVDKTLYWHHFGGFYQVTAYWPDALTLEDLNVD